MYEVMCDNYLLYSSNIENLILVNPKVSLEDNKTGSFTFTIYPDHPYYSAIKKLNSIITVYQDKKILFRGRVLNEELGFRNQKSISCEGELAFFLDSIQRPYDYTGSITGFLQQLINNHNAEVDNNKKFTLGNVTVTDPNDTIVRSDTNYTSTWKVIEEKLIKSSLGGHIVVRHENNVNYIDYLADFTTISGQSVEFAKNLIDMKRTINGGSIITALIPIGGKVKDDDGNESRITIASVNDNKDYIFDQTAVNNYGWIFGTKTWNDVTLPSNLLTKGQEYLRECLSPTNSIDLTAADLSGTDADIGSFKIGTRIHVSSSPHGIDENFFVSKLAVDLLNPANNNITLNGTIETFSEYNKAISDEQTSIRKDLSDVSDSVSKAYDVIVADFKAEIKTSENNITQTVAETYLTKDDQVLEERFSKTTQEVNSITDEFSQFKLDYNTDKQQTNDGFTEIKSYIKRENGKILLYNNQDDMMLQIANNKISFMQNNSEVAYVSDRKLFITDGEFLNSLILGNFAFIPRANGNLSFKKIK